MEIDTGIPESARKEVAEGLSGLLADTYTSVTPRRAATASSPSSPPSPRRRARPRRSTWSVGWWRDMKR
jgi:hypothetical protein